MTEHPSQKESPFKRQQDFILSAQSKAQLAILHILAMSLSVLLSHFSLYCMLL